ncbi:MAG: hypothetical protein EXQ70_07695 [Solirubrobacterales bacterium]|nr:hypothetical protein [Solirubrobacterales bacterium]
MFERGINEASAERLLSGRVRGSDTGEHAELAEFLRAVPTALAEGSPREVEVTMVRRLAQTARVAAQEGPPQAASAPSRPRRRRLALLAGAATVIALFPALIAGLAFAGVKLPDPVSEAFEGVGVELPNQAATDARDGASGQEGSSEAGDGRQSPVTTRPGDIGPRAGIRPAKRREARRRAVGPSASAREDPNGEAVRRGPNPNPRTPRGQANGPPAQSNAGGNGHGNAGGGGSQGSQGGGNGNGNAGGGGSQGSQGGGNGNGAGGSSKPAEPPGQAKKG